MGEPRLLSRRRWHRSEEKNDSPACALARTSRRGQRWLRTTNAISQPLRETELWKLDGGRGVSVSSPFRFLAFSTSVTHWRSVPDSAAVRNGVSTKVVNAREISLNLSILGVIGEKRGISWNSRAFLCVGARPNNT